MRAILSLLLLVWFLKLSGFAAESSNDEEKRKQFLKAREEMKTAPMTPSPEASPKPKPKPVQPATTPPPEPPTTPKPMPETVATPRPKPKPEPEATPKPRPKPEPEATPRPKPVPEATPKPKPPPVTPRPVTPAPRPTVSAPIVIEKTGFENQRVQPAPPPGWFEKWKYLSKSVRAEIDRAPVVSHRWRYIVVHNSGTRQGNAKAFDYYHLHVRKMPNGLAYQFVIGNGTSTGDGQIEVGNRWRRQINGGHVHSDYLNNIALGICLVGDYNRDTPTQKQLEACEELIRYLRVRVGKIDRQFAIVKAHREINPPRWPTDCPGDKFPYGWLHGKFD